MRIACLTILLALGLAADARACSCLAPDVEAAVRSGEAAFEGVVVSREPVGTPRAGQEPVYDHTVRVVREYNVDLPSRVTVRGGGFSASCGVSWRRGERFGLWVDEPVAQPIEASLCATVDPTDLRRAADPLPRPSGRGRLALLVGGQVGRNGSLTAYDDHGRLLAYGFGGGRVLAACPGGARFLQQGRGRRLLVRSASSLRVLRTLRFPVRPDQAACRDRQARDVVVLGGRKLARPGELVGRVPGQGMAILGRSAALATAGEEGQERVNVVDLESGAAREVAQLSQGPGVFAFSPDGRRAAFLASDIRDPAHGVRTTVFALELESGELSRHDVDEADDGTVVWTSADEFLLVPGRPRRRALRFDARAQPIGTRPSLRGGWMLAAVPPVAYGLADGHLYGAVLPGGYARRLARLPTAQPSGLLAVPERPRLRASRRVPRRRTLRAAAAAARCAR